ncbi:MAG: DsrE family protein [Siculibacillus sp.]|nr:DsrE family protein [Siculibacillus sp.]
MSATTIRIDVKLLAVAVIAAVIAVGGWQAWRIVGPRPKVDVPRVVTDFGHQKVIYHLTEGGGYLGREHRNWLGNMENHFAALEPGELDLVVVMNGDGVDLLTHAAADEKLAARIDALKARGARFLVCRNTLISRGIEPASLYGLRTGDLIGAGVAQIALLERQGYGYLKP